tara:strand:+ start:208 stop:435 length:228 start_codon:yes stop_codon:yes gene_type:complete
MTDQEVFEVIAKALDVASANITIDTLSSDIPDWDSLGHLTIFMELESAFPEDYNSDPRFASVVSVKEIIDIMRGN